MQANRSLGNIFFMPKDYLVFLRNFISFKTASFYIGKSVAIFHPTESRIFFESSILHCVKSVRIRSYSGPHFPVFGLNTERKCGILVRMRENADQNNSEYGLFSRSEELNFQKIYTYIHLQKRMQNPVKHPRWSV